jgi:hypothetical protein
MPRASLGGVTCVGDCNGDGMVSVSELITGVNIGLGAAAVTDCAAFDVDSDGAVGISELVTAVSAALSTCAGALTAASFVDQMTVLDFFAVGEQRSGRPPDRPGAPAAQAPGHVNVVNGGSAEVQVQSDTPFSAIALSVDAGGAEGHAAALVDGFFIVTLPEEVTSATVQLLIPQDVPSDAFTWLFQIGTPDGFGAPALTAVDVVPVGTGDVQVSVAWDSDADVDLHVVDPLGYEIYWLEYESPTGGMLDLDSNAGCASDGPRNENITWPTGTAPAGPYIVRLDYFANCTADLTNYTVTVRRTGQEAEVFRGTFEGPGDAGGPGAGRLITEFSLP